MKPEGYETRARFIFAPKHDQLLSAVLAIAALLFVMTLVVSYGYWEGPAWQKVAVAGPQPVPFSHKHHVADMGIDCRYCHTGVDSSSYAGVAPTETCMTCHSQIWTSAALLQPVRDSAQYAKPIVWRQVTSIPDYVYFDHSAHVNRGVACVSCHGRVDQMAMTYQAVEMKMSWCIACHREPEKHLVPTSQVAQPVPDLRAGNLVDWNVPPLPPISAQEKARLTNCTTCHR